MKTDKQISPSLAAADWLCRTETQAVFSALARDGHGVRAVGGAVRNTLMGLPAADIDLATTARPETVLELARSAGFDAIPTGLKHGTVTVVANHIPFEVTTLRQDIETFGRHAEVAFTDDWAADARRRDFTMNALYCDANGTLFDPLGGYSDLAARRVRFIGKAEDRIREDYLRILRFFRFIAEYGRTQSEIDAEGLLASTRLANGLDLLSGERIRQELVRLMAAPGAFTAIDAMQNVGVLTRILRRAPRPGLLRRLIDIEERTGSAPNPLLRLGILAVETPEDADTLSSRLRLSGEERDTLRLVAAGGGTQRALALTERSRETLYRLGAEQFSKAVLVAWVRSAAPASDNIWRKIALLPEQWHPGECPIKGSDAVAAGIQPGPAVGAAVRRLEEAWIASDFSLRREALLDLLKRDVQAGDQS